MLVRQDLLKAIEEYEYSLGPEYDKSSVSPRAVAKIHAYYSLA